MANLAVWRTTSTTNIYQLYVNGAFEAKLSVAEVAIAATNPNVPPTILGHAGGTDDPNGIVTLNYVWNRVLTAPEMLWIAKEPYAFLQPVPAVRYWGQVPATGGTGVISTGGATLNTGLRIPILARFP